MARCLVVGGNGFLGSHVVDLLAERGHAVTVFDRFTSHSAAYSQPGVARVTGDFADRAVLAAALDGQEFLFHLLSATTPASAEENPSADLSENVARSVDLFQLAVEAGVSRVHFASTGGAMYGNATQHRIDEDAVPAPVSPYAIGKLAIEGYLRYFRRRDGLQSVSYRISNPYGARQRPDKKQGVIPIFLQRIAQGRPIELFGDGSAVRDYIYVSDAARMIADSVGRELDHDVYNIGSGTGTTLAEVVSLAREVTGREVIVQEHPAPSTFVDRVVLDTSRYAAEFGAPQLVPLADGMALTWREIMEHHR